MRQLAAVPSEQVRHAELHRLQLAVVVSVKAVEMHTQEFGESPLNSALARQVRQPVGEVPVWQVKQVEWHWIQLEASSVGA